MSNEPIRQVFYNDYIMTDILRMLNLKQQYELQKVCQRLRFLVVKCVWAKDYSDIRMNHIRTGSLTEEDFFDFLQVNAINITKLTIQEIDGCEFDKYIQTYYENLFELRIKGFSLDDKDFLNIYKNCPRLQTFRYEKPTARFTSCNEKSSKNDIWSLARNVPLQRLELYNIQIWRNDSSSLNNLKVLKIYTNLLDSLLESVKLMDNCPNLEELDLAPSRTLMFDFCTKYTKLEKFKLSRSITLKSIWNVLGHKKLKVLELDGFIDSRGGCKYGKNVRGFGKTLERLKVNQTIFLNEDVSRDDIWLAIFNSPSTNFENLQELCMRNQQTNDDFIYEISRKCPLLKILRLCHCATSGRYINQLQKLETLDLEDISLPMPSIHLYSIVHDLKFLKYLKLYRQNFISEESTPEDCNNLLIELEVCVKGQQISFLRQILKYCNANSVNIQMDGATLSLNIFHNLFVESESSLHALELRNCKTSANDKSGFGPLPFVKLLLLFDCQMMLKWSSILEHIKYSKMETVKIIGTPIYDAHFSCPLESDLDILKHFQSIIIPYDIFRKKLRFWQWCFEESTKFQLCCFDHKDHRHVLNNLLDNLSIGCISSIHVNVELNPIKYFCGDLAISVAWLEYEELGIEKQFFEYDTMVIVIKK